MNIVILKKKIADSDETDDSVYPVESGYPGDFLGLCHPKLWVGVGQKSKVKVFQKTKRVCEFLFVLKQ